MGEFLQHLFNGLMIGGVYALMGIGLTLIFGVMRVVNWAHGEFYMLGAYVVYTMTVWWGLPYLAALLVSAIALAIFGIVVERLLLRPVRHHPADVAMLALVGLSIALAGLAQVIWGAPAVSIKLPFPLVGIAVGPVTLTPVRIFILVTALTIILGTHALLQRTRVGKAVRATFQDREVAALMGININQINALTFAAGGAIAAIAGGLLGPIFTVAPNMGAVATAKSFAVVVAGGLGSFPGAILAGLLLGVAESYGAAYVSSGYRDAIAFIMIIAVLLIRPSGLLGKTRRIG
jgi:branched-chain amino acid transport system permease protein